MTMLIRHPLVLDIDYTMFGCTTATHELVQCSVALLMWRILGIKHDCGRLVGRTILIQRCSQSSLIPRPPHEPGNEAKSRGALSHCGPCCWAPCTPHLKLIEPLLWQCLHCSTMLILHYLLPPVFEARGLARDGTTLDTYVKVEFCV